VSTPGRLGTGRNNPCNMPFWRARPPGTVTVLVQSSDIADIKGAADLDDLCTGGRFRPVVPDAFAARKHAEEPLGTSRETGHAVRLAREAKTFKTSDTQTGRTPTTE